MATSQVAMRFKTVAECLSKTHNPKDPSEADTVWARFSIKHMKVAEIAIQHQQEYLSASARTHPVDAETHLTAIKVSEFL
jgi:6-phosphogluconolactonase (cycloisomerase 2 family)